MASNRINGANIGRFDAQHTRVAPRQYVETVAPHVLRDLKNKYELDVEDLDVEELLALLTQDELELSEEAMDLLRKVKKRKKKRGRGRREQDSEEDFLELLEQLDEQEVKNPAELGGKEAPKPFIPPVIQLSNYNPAAREAQQKKISQAGTNSHDNDDDYLRLNRAGRIAMAMVAVSPSKTSAKKVAKDLEAFGSDVVAEVKRFGTRIIIVGPQEPITKIKLGSLYLFGAGEKTHDGRDWSGVRGAYSARRRVIVLGEELLDSSRRGGRSVVRHEFAHAYEDAWSTKRKRKFPLGVELWYRFEKTRKAFISDYASTKPAEYFAESVEAFFHPQNRRRLAQADPDMYNYLSELLAAPA